ncbi:MAG: glycosyltransferase family 1 protein [Pseudonocardiales bacterium]|nr:MAG: glycosyltransferase family 1 protein [Pseudonocardiales bacterium]
MRVLMLSWEYPPLVVGGLGRHVEALARELTVAGHDVRVVARGDGDFIVDELRDGVRVRRSALDPIAIDFTTETLLSWAQAAEHSLLRAALPVVRRWRPEVVHAHDWLVAQAGVTLAQVTGAPLVATIHATESGRNQGWLSKPLNVAIHSVERWLAHQATAVITCSSAMHDEVTKLFGLPDEQVTVVPNGIDALRWQVTPAARRAARRALGGDGPVVVFAGRLVHEKGLQTVLSALPVLRRVHPGLRLVVAGTGGHLAELQAQARRLRVARGVDWLGFVPEEALGPLLAAADVAVVPSLYEPFGIVALEVAAVRTPLVVACTGGLVDLVSSGVAAGAFAPRDTAALAAAVLSVLADPVGAKRAVSRAARVIRRDYTWAAVAERTGEGYRLGVRG